MMMDTSAYGPIVDYRAPFSNNARRQRGVTTQTITVPTETYRTPLYRAPPVYGSKNPRYYVQRTPGGQVMSEIKYFDSTLLVTTINAAGTTGAGCEVDPATLNTLFAPSQGNDISNREGRKVWVRKITVKGHVAIPPQINQVAGDEGLVIRLALLCDKQTNGTQYNSEDVFLSGTGGDMINAYQNTSNFGRFVIYKDKYMNFYPKTITWDGTNLEQQGDIRHFKFTKKFIDSRSTFKGMLVNFNSTNGGTVADIVDNSFHMYAAASTPTSGNLAAALFYKCRVAFTD